MVGNPGSTGRLLTMAQMEYLRDVQYPAQLATYKEQIDIYKELVGQSEANKRKYENNGLRAGELAEGGDRLSSGLVDPAIMARKAAFEQDFRSRILAKPDLTAKYGRAWDNIAVAQKELASFADGRSSSRASRGSTAAQLRGRAGPDPEQGKLPDSLRLPQYRGEGLARIKAGRFGRRTSEPRRGEAAAGRRNSAWRRRRCRRVTRSWRPRWAAGARRWRRRTWSTAPSWGRWRRVRRCSTAARRRSAASDDPMIVLARKVNPLATQACHARRCKLNTTISANVELVGQAIYAAYGESLPPDATFTLRISDGVVKGFPYNGTIAPYKTSFYGLYARSAEFDDQPPFKLPPRWQAARSLVDMTTPLNFVLTADIIGGNSGSPVINRNGEVVGLIFDGNIESLPNRFIFTDEVARSVAVHTKGIVEALRKVYGAARLADEVEGAGAKK